LHEYRRKETSQLATHLLEIAVIDMRLVAANAWHTRDAPYGPAPVFKGMLPDGTTISLTDLKGKPAPLHFWATWCPVCGLEQGTIDAIADDCPVRGVATDEAMAEQIRICLQDEDVDYRVIHDRDFAIFRQFSIRGRATSFILDTDSQIRFVGARYRTGIGLRLRM